MRKRAGFVVLVAVCLVVSGIFLAACSGQNGASKASSSVSSASATSAASATSSSQSGGSSGADAERQAATEKMASLKEAYEQTVATKDDWADGVVIDSLNKLAEEGAIAPLPEDFQLFDNTFQFEPAEVGYDIVYLNDAAKEQLTGDFALDLSDGSKVALCCEYRMVNEDGSRMRDVTVPYTDKEGKFSVSSAKQNEKLLSTPTLAPAGWQGTFETLRSSVSDKDFADNTEECRYLIAYGSCYSKIDEDFYSVTPTASGTIDRVSTTTVVLVIDAQNREVLHIENIGTDVPGGSVDAARSENYGKQLTKEALAYIAKILPSD